MFKRAKLRLKVASSVIAVGLIAQASYNAYDAPNQFQSQLRLVFPSYKLDGDAEGRIVKVKSKN